MIWVLVGVFVCLTILLIVGDCEEGAGVVGLTAVLLAGVAFFLVSKNINGKVIDSKIEMYSEENTKIEESISDLVSEYMEFESETFKDLKGDDSITLISLYPELKSDELIKAQIEIYQENNEKIKELKESRLNLTLVRWWLYFGS